MVSSINLLFGMINFTH